MPSPSHTPQVWVLLVLLASWIQLPGGEDFGDNIQVVEFFAGKRRVARLAKSLGLVATAHDIMYDEEFKKSSSGSKSKSKSKSCMDINTPAGFL